MEEIRLSIRQHPLSAEGAPICPGDSILQAEEESVKNERKVKDTEGLKRLREKAGVTQAALADALGVDRTTVTTWEIGRSFPRAELLPKLAAALGCEIGELFAGKEKEA